MRQPVADESLGDRNTLVNGMLSMLRLACAKMGKSGKSGRCIPQDLDEDTDLRYQAVVTIKDDVPTMELRVPERSGYRRAFQKFGSTRFCFVKVKQSLTKLGAAALDEFCQRKWQLGGGTFQFLQGKELMESDSSMIYFAPSADLSVRVLRRWHIPPTQENVNQDWTLGKENARWDLCFSDTKVGRMIPVDQIEVVADLKAPDGSIHDDGNGLIPAAWLAEIQEQLGERHAATAFQCRLGSIKGILKADPNVDHIVVPESMKKWALPTEGEVALEINNGGWYDLPKTSKLNRCGFSSPNPHRILTESSHNLHLVLTESSPNPHVTLTKLSTDKLCWPWKPLAFPGAASNPSRMRCLTSMRAAFSAHVLRARRTHAWRVTQRATT